MSPAKKNQNSPTAAEEAMTKSQKASRIRELATLLLYNLDFDVELECGLTRVLMMQASFALRKKLETPKPKII